MATIANIYIDAGADYSNIITVAASNGFPLNLSGYTVKSQLRKSYTSSTYHNFTASIYDAANGKVRLQLSSAQSEAIVPGRYLYDVEITSSLGTKTRVISPDYSILPFEKFCKEVELI